MKTDPSISTLREYWKWDMAVSNFLRARNRRTSKKWVNSMHKWDAKRSKKGWQ